MNVASATGADEDVTGAGFNPHLVIAVNVNGTGVNDPDYFFLELQEGYSWDGGASTILDKIIADGVVLDGNAGESYDIICIRGGTRPATHAG